MSYSKGKNILLIDDCSDNQLLMKLLLESQGYSFKSACSGKDGLAEVKKKVPDLIILDMMMPDMSGLDVLAALKSDDAFARIPVLLCTAHRYLSPEDLSQADDVCYKPFDLDDLLTKINNLINCGRKIKSSTLFMEVKEEDPLYKEHKHLLSIGKQKNLREEMLKKQGYEVVNR